MGVVDRQQVRGGEVRLALRLQTPRVDSRHRLPRLVACKAGFRMDNFGAELKTAESTEGLGSRGEN